MKIGNYSLLILMLIMSYSLLASNNRAGFIVNYEGFKSAHQFRKSLNFGQVPFAIPCELQVSDPTRNPELQHVAKVGNECVVCMSAGASISFSQYIEEDKETKEKHDFFAACCTARFHPGCLDGWVFGAGKLTCPHCRNARLLSRKKSALIMSPTNNIPDVNAKDAGGYTPIVHAIQEKDLGRVNGLIVRGANINATFLMGWTPLIMASIEGSLDIVNTLLENKANVDTQDQDGCTATMHALNDKLTPERIKIITALLECGANVNLKDKNGRFPLLRAVKRDNLEVVKALLSNGAIDFGDQAFKEARNPEIRKVLIDAKK